MDLFSDLLSRLKHELRTSKDQEIAAALGMSKTAFSERKKRNSFPEKELLALAAARPELGIDTQYVLTGRATRMAFGTAKQIGTRLRNERQRINWSEADMAQHLGCALADYVALEQGLRATSTQEVMALREHDELDADMVLGGASLKRPEWALEKNEAELLTNYRASSDEGRESLLTLSAFTAQYHARQQPLQASLA